MAESKKKAGNNSSFLSFTKSIPGEWLVIKALPFLAEFNRLSVSAIF